jgi:cardiolipin synthase
VGTDATRDTRVWTVPNLLSAARLGGVPLFLWLVLGPEADGWALLVLMVSGVTDYADGWLAASWTSRPSWGRSSILSRTVSTSSPWSSASRCAT